MHTCVCTKILFVGMYVYASLVKPSLSLNRYTNSSFLEHYESGIEVTTKWIYTLRVGNAFTTLSSNAPNWYNQFKITTMVSEVSNSRMRLDPYLEWFPGLNSLKTLRHKSGNSSSINPTMHGVYLYSQVLRYHCIIRSRRKRLLQSLWYHHNCQLG